MAGSFLVLGGFEGGDAGLVLEGGEGIGLGGLVEAVVGGLKGHRATGQVASGVLGGGCDVGGEACGEGLLC